MRKRVICFLIKSAAKSINTAIYLAEEADELIDVKPFHHVLNLLNDLYEQQTGRDPVSTATQVAE